MGSDEPIAQQRVRAHHAEEPHVLLQRAERARAQARDDGGGRSARSTASSPNDVPARRARAADAALDRGAPPRARLDLQDLGRDGRVVLGPRARPVRRGRRGAPARRGDHEGPQGRRARRCGPSTTTRREHALRRARVRHRRLQAAPLRADLRARLRRLQRQGDAHRHDAARGGHPGDDRHRAHGDARRHRARPRRASRRSITRSPTCRRSTSTSTAPPSTPARPSCPSMDRGAFALQINEGNPKLVHLPEPPPEASITRRKLDVALAPDGAAQFDLELTVDRRLRARRGGSATSPRGRGASARSATSRGELGALELAAGKAGLDVNDLDDEEQPVRIRARGKALGFARRDGDALSVPAGPDAPPRRRLRLALEAHARRRPARAHRARRRVDDPPARRHEGDARAPTPAQLDTPFGRFSVAFEEGAGKVVVKHDARLQEGAHHPGRVPGLARVLRGGRPRLRAADRGEPVTPVRGSRSTPSPRGRC